jgi:GTP-binding protein
MFDGKQGPNADFEDIVRWLRKIKTDDPTKWKREVVILGNKLEGDAWANYYNEDSLVIDHLSEVSRLGFGEAIAISAEHGEGMADLAALIEDLTTKKKTFLGLDESKPMENDIKTTEVVSSKTKPLRLAILGRQNVGECCSKKF